MSVVAEPLWVPGPLVLRPEKHIDARGFLSETYSRAAFAEKGLDIDFVQDNHVFSRTDGTVRGLHFQIPPFAQHKLIRVVRGRIFDVAVDIREGSTTYAQHVSVTISADDWNQLFIPVGFAHGFLALEPNTEVLYKVSKPYSPEHDKGLLWNDPALSIEWPDVDGQISLSERDGRQPLLADLPSYFSYEPQEA